MGRKLLFFAAALYTLVLSGSSLLSLREVPMEKLSMSDKAMHAIAYFLLVIAWQIAFSFSKKSSNKNLLWFVGLGAFLFGIVIEVLQGVVTSYREPDIYDVLANSAGILLAVVLIIAVKRKVMGGS